MYYKHIQHKTGIQIPIGTQIEEGLKIEHFGNVVIAQSSKIGKNVTLHQGVTIGRVFNGPMAGVPSLGESVIVFAGATIIGNVNIGDGAVIGANALVRTSVPANCVVAGAPAKIVSNDANKCFSKKWGLYFAHGYYE